MVDEKSPRPKACFRTTRWRLIRKASSVGRGLIADATSRPLISEHWLEVADPRHRYGSLLKEYHKLWQESDTNQNFFFWLDYGEGKNIDLEEYPRKLLNDSTVTYLTTEERKQYAVTVQNGLLTYEESGDLVHTDGGDGSKWIFVVDPQGTLYIAKKVRGKFHHSSFLSGGTTKEAGNLSVWNGVLTRISPSSGHYRPIPEDVHKFLKILEEKGIDIKKVQVEPL